MQLAGTSLGFNLIGGAIDSPGLQSASSATNKFIGPAVDISVGGYLVRQVRGFKRR